METTKMAERKVFGMGGIARTMVLTVFAALLALTMVASVGAKDAQALSDTSANRDALIREARTHLGEPYVLGTPNPCSRKAVDCECFNRLVYNKFGESLPNTPTGQSKAGQYRSLSAMKKGDIMIFRNSRGAVYHVGMYYGKDSAGNRLVIHASTYTKDVTITQLKYLKGFSGARDVL